MIKRKFFRLFLSMFLLFPFSSTPVRADATYLLWDIAFDATADEIISELELREINVVDTGELFDGIIGVGPLDLPYHTYPKAQISFGFEDDSYVVSQANLDMENYYLASNVLYTEVKEIHHKIEAYLESQKELYTYFVNEYGAPTAQYVIFGREHMDYIAFSGTLEEGINTLLTLAQDKYQGGILNFEWNNFIISIYSDCAQYSEDQYYPRMVTSLLWLDEAHLEKFVQSRELISYEEYVSLL